jgi:hypothetical protein
MQYEFRGKSLAEAVSGAVRGAHNRLEHKRAYDISALPLRWSAWVDVWAQFAVLGPDADRNVTRVRVNFFARRGASSFDYEIEGGDRPIRGYATGTSSASATETVTITGNVATSIRVRCKSHSMPLHIRVTTN